MVFRAPNQFVVKETEHWIVNHRVDSKLPGYLMVAARMETTHLFDLPEPALSELGPLLASVQKSVLDLLRPEHIYAGRYGHQLGHSIHFHIIPIYSWLKEMFVTDSRYSVLKSFYTPGAANTDFDGAEMTLFVWREYCESKNPPRVIGPSVEEAVILLRKSLN